MPIDIAVVCKCPNVGRLLAGKMLSQERGEHLTYLKTYDWNSMYCSPEVSGASVYYKVEEPDLLTREHHRRRRNEAEWQAVRRQYPEHLWGLTIPAGTAPKTSPDALPHPRRAIYPDDRYSVEDDSSKFRDTRPVQNSATPASYETSEYDQQSSYSNPVDAQGYSSPRRPVPTEIRRHRSSKHADPSRTGSQSSEAPKSPSNSGHYPAKYPDQTRRHNSGASVRPRTSAYYSSTNPDERDGLGGKSPEHPQYYSPSVPDRTGGQSPGESVGQEKPSVSGGTSSKNTKRSKKPNEQGGWEGFKGKFKSKHS